MVSYKDVVYTAAFAGHGQLHQDSMQALAELFVCVFVVVLHHSNGISVMSWRYEMRRRKPEPTLLPTQIMFNLPHHIVMV